MTYALACGGTILHVVSDTNRALNRDVIESAFAVRGKSGNLFSYYLLSIFLIHFTGTKRHIFNFAVFQLVYARSERGKIDV